MADPVTALNPRTSWRQLTTGDSHFFGFHDFSPWDPSGRKLLVLRTATPEARIPSSADEASVGLLDQDSGAFDLVGTTRAWNWQQGARQRWVPGSGAAVFNAGLDARVASVWIDPARGLRRELPHFVYDVEATGTQAVSLNMRRLAALYPGYGYALEGAGRTAVVDASLEEEGLFLLDLESGARRLHLSIAEVVRGLNYEATPAAADYFTHASFSPDGSRVVLLHRRNLPGGSIVTNMIVTDLAGGWRAIARDKVSHFDWADEATIVAWCRSNPLVGRVKDMRWKAPLRLLYRLSRRVTSRFLRQALFNEAFFTIDVNTQARTVFGKGSVTEDGHPMVNPVHRHIWVIDTYPDASGYQALFLFDARRERRVEVARLRANPAVIGTSWRCDLHPRWSPDGRQVCVDSSHAGRRQLVVFDVGRVVEDLAGGSA